MDEPIFPRKFHVGAEIIDDGVHFRVWSPLAKTIDVVIEELDSLFMPETFRLFPLKKEENSGYFSRFIKEAKEGSLYRIKIDGDERLYPDPASRYQPKGPHGPSQIVDYKKFNWSDQSWKGLHSESKVIYELHIGTFTKEGTWEKAKEELQELSEIGINVIEMMPIAEFPGQFGWGYDGVNLFAPSHLYGTPNQLKEFINQAHRLGIAVILDVVYNHFGPDGNYLSAFSPSYCTSKYKTEWGEAINFDDANSHEVRQYYICNACYWIEEYHFDGLRFDATQSIFDDSSEHILKEISKNVRLISPEREKYLIAENESQLTKMVRSFQEDGYGLNALWNDDFHHTSIVRLTGFRDAYYTDYLGTCQEFISSLKYGYLYQGQWYVWQNKTRGSTSLDLHPSHFVNFIQNHDQIANRPQGLRIHQLTDPGNFRAMTALMLLAPQTPLLFQGQEFSASSPFYFFADHNEELAKLVVIGRREHFNQFKSFSFCREIQKLLPDPSEYDTFLKCKLNFEERKKHHKIYQMHKDLLNLRHNDSVFKSPKKGGLDGAVLNEDAFVLRYFGKNETRLIIVNFGVDLTLNPIPEPLLAPPEKHEWIISWSSEHSDYGGGGISSIIDNNHWYVLGHSLTVFVPQKTMEK